MEPTEADLKAQKEVFMERVRKEYKETPIETSIPALKNLIKKLSERGFNFEPFSLVKEIDAEADKQFKRLTSDTLSGLTVGALSAIKNEIIKWYNEEEERFQVFTKEFAKKELKKLDAELPIASGVALEELQKQEQLANVTVMPTKKKGKK